LKIYLPPPAQLARCDVEREEDVLACRHAALGDGFEHDFDCFAIGPQVGAKPPRRPRPSALRLQDAAERGKISAPARTASANDEAPTGITMNSWKSSWCPRARRR
jgi:hypothetical protein